MIPLNHTLSQLRRSGIRVFTNLARATPGCAMLTIGEPDLDTPDSIKQAAIAALNRSRTHYAPNQGTDALRRAVADYETLRGHATAPEEVLITLGATQGLFCALMTVLNPGEEVIVPVPGFGLYESITTIAGGRFVPLDVSKTGFQITRESLEAAVTEKTKAIDINSPCNPTGVIFSQESLEAVKQTALDHNLFLIWDHVYHQLCYSGVCPDLSLDPQLKEQMILCQSFSKPYAMTGWRLGYVTCPGYVMERMLLLSAAQIAAVPTFLQDAALEALNTDVQPIRQIYRRRRDYVCRRLTQMGLRYPQPEGAFYVFADIRPLGLDSETFCTRMIREGKVAAVPGSCFGVEGYIRLSYCYSDSELETALDRMETFLRTLR